MARWDPGKYWRKVIPWKQIQIESQLLCSSVCLAFGKQRLDVKTGWGLQGDKPHVNLSSPGAGAKKKTWTCVQIIVLCFLCKFNHWIIWLYLFICLKQPIFEAPSSWLFLKFFISVGLRIGILERVFVTCNLNSDLVLQSVLRDSITVHSSKYRCKHTRDAFESRSLRSHMWTLSFSSVNVNVYWATF